MIDDAFGHWLAGFADGEACFRVMRHVGGKGSVGYSPVFAIHLRRDDRLVLDEIVARLGHGRVTFLERRGHRSPMACLRVGDRAGCAALVETFDRCRLRAKKARDYAIWRAAVAEWLRVGPYDFGGFATRGSGRDWSRMVAIKAELEDVRRWIDDDEQVAIPMPPVFEQLRLEVPR